MGILKKKKQQKNKSKSKKWNYQVEGFVQQFWPILPNDSPEFVPTLNYFRIPILETLDLAGRTWILVYGFFFCFKVYKMQPKSKVVEEKHHIYPLALSILES